MVNIPHVLPDLIITTTSLYRWRNQNFTNVTYPMSPARKWWSQYLNSSCSDSRVLVRKCNSTMP